MQTGFTRFPTPFICGFLSHSPCENGSLETRGHLFQERALLRPQRLEVSRCNRTKMLKSPGIREASAIEVAPPRKRDAGSPGQCSNFTGMGVFG